MAIRGLPLAIAYVPATGLRWTTVPLITCGFGFTSFSAVVLGAIPGA
jgi:hypothetical protein